MTKLRLAVVGGGHLGRIHARLLSARPDVDLIAVADPSPEARERVVSDCGARVVGDYRELITRVDGVIVATPTKLHRSVAIDFLRHGIAALVEKPLAGTLAEADDMVRIAHRVSAVLQVGHVERFNPALSAALPYLGPAKYIEATRAGGFTFRSTDIGVVLDLMIHDLDIAMAVADSPVTRVDALGMSIWGAREDIAHARIEFASGCVANLSASRASAEQRRTMQICSDQATASIDFARCAVNITRPSEAIRSHEFDVEKLSPQEQLRLKDCLLAEHLPTETLTVEPRNAIADEQEDFITAIRTARAPRVSGETARDTLVVAEQILAKIAAHRWQDVESGASTSIIRGPHWAQVEQPSIRHEAS